MKSLSPTEQRIWANAYAAAFVEQSAAMARTMNTSHAAAAQHPEWQASIAEAARGIADSAIIALRTTHWAGSPFTGS
jgi:hypothetical protein